MLVMSAGVIQEGIHNSLFHTQVVYKSSFLFFFLYKRKICFSEMVFIKYLWFFSDCYSSVCVRFLLSLDKAQPCAHRGSLRVGSLMITLTQTNSAYFCLKGTAYSCSLVFTFSVKKILTCSIFNKLLLHGFCRCLGINNSLLLSIGKMFTKG